jgi:hypothetical protein
LLFVSCCLPLLPIAVCDVIFWAKTSYENPGGSSTQKVSSLVVYDVFFNLRDWFNYLLTKACSYNELSSKTPEQIMHDIITHSKTAAQHVGLRRCGVTAGLLMSSNECIVMLPGPPVLPSSKQVQKVLLQQLDQAALLEAVYAHKVCKDTLHGCNSCSSSCRSVILQLLCCMACRM